MEIIPLSGSILGGNQQPSTSGSPGTTEAASGPLNGFHIPASSKPSQNGPLTRALPQWLSGKSFGENRPTHRGFSLPCSATSVYSNQWGTRNGFTRPVIQPPFWRAWVINNQHLVRNRPPRQRPRPRQSRKRLRRRRPRPPAIPVARLLQKPLNPPEPSLGHSPRPFRRVPKRSFP